MIHHSRTAYVRNIRIARLFAHAGDATSAITFLERAFCERESPLVHLAVAWDWEAISAHSGFISLVDRIGIVPTSKGID